MPSSSDQAKEGFAVGSRRDLWPRDSATKEEGLVEILEMEFSCGCWTGVISLDGFPFGGI